MIGGGGRELPPPPYLFFDWDELSHQSYAWLTSQYVTSKLYNKKGQDQHIFCWRQHFLHGRWPKMPKIRRKSAASVTFEQFMQKKVKIILPTDCWCFLHSEQQPFIVHGKKTAMLLRNFFGFYKNLKFDTCKNTFLTKTLNLHVAKFGLFSL